jgi:hypothetical protein
MEGEQMAAAAVPSWWEGIEASPHVTDIIAKHKQAYVNNTP